MALYSSMAVAPYKTLSLAPRQPISKCFVPGCQIQPADDTEESDPSSGTPLLPGRARRKPPAATRMLKGRAQALEEAFLDSRETVQSAWANGRVVKAARMG